MAINDFLTLATLAVAIVLVTPPLGRYMYRVFEGERTILTPILRPVERLVYRGCGVVEAAEHDWKGYVIALLVFDLVSFLAGYAMLRLQDVLPLNPAGIAPMTPDLAFNTAVSFTTNTNWQNYGGEATMSPFTQMVGLTVQQFVSAAAGMAVLDGAFRGGPR